MWPSRARFCAGRRWARAPDADAWMDARAGRGGGRRRSDRLRLGRGRSGGRFVKAALEAGAWGVLSEPPYVEAPDLGGGARLAAADPLAALHRLARAWRRELRAQVVGITGSTGKTSTKELLRALI